MQYGRCLQYTTFEIVTNQKLMRIIVTNTIRFDTATMYAVLVLLFFLFVFFSIYIYTWLFCIPVFFFMAIAHLPENIMLMRNVSMQFDTAIYAVLVFLLFSVWLFGFSVYMYIYIWSYCIFHGNYMYMRCNVIFPENIMLTVKTRHLVSLCQYPVFFPMGVELHAVLCKLIKSTRR